MEQIKRYMVRWTKGRAPAEVAALGIACILIAVVPGALMALVAWRFLRPRAPSRAPDLPGRAACAAGFTVLSWSDRALTRYAVSDLDARIPNT